MNTVIKLCRKSDVSPERAKEVADSEMVRRGFAQNMGRTCDGLDDPRVAEEFYGSIQKSDSNPIWKNLGSHFPNFCYLEKFRRLMPPEILEEVRFVTSLNLFSRLLVLYSSREEAFVLYGRFEDADERPRFPIAYWGDADYIAKVNKAAEEMEKPSIPVPVSVSDPCKPSGMRAVKVMAIPMLVVLTVLGFVFGPSICHKVMPVSSVTESDSALGKLIKQGNFSYVNSDITEVNFPDVSTGQAEAGISADFKVYSFGRYISSEDAIKEMEKDGYKPANLRELIAYSKNGWNGTDTVVALGQIWRGSVGGRRVPYAWGDSGERRLDLLYFERDWSGSCRFLAVRNS